MRCNYNKSLNIFLYLLQITVTKQLFQKLHLLLHILKLHLFILIKKARKNLRVLPRTVCEKILRLIENGKKIKI